MANVKCKNCGADIGAQSKFCSACGKPYGYCPKCGEPRAHDDTLCAACGNELTPVAETAPTEPMPQAADPQAQAFDANQSVVFAGAASEPEIKGKALLDEFVTKDASLSRILFIATQVIMFLSLGVFFVLIVLVFTNNVDPALLYVGLFADLCFDIAMSFIVSVIRLIIDLVKVSGLKEKIKSGAADVEGYIKRHSPVKKYTMFAFGSKKNSQATAYNKLFAAGYVSKSTGNYVLYVLNAVFTGLFTLALIPVFSVYLIAIFGVAAAGETAAAILGIVLAMLGIVLAIGIVPIVISIVLTVLISKYSKTIV